MKKDRILLISQFHPPEMEPSGFMFSSLAKSLGDSNLDIHLLSGFPNFPRGKFSNNDYLKIFHSIHVDGYIQNRVIVYPSANKNNFSRIVNYLSFATMSFIRAIFIPRIKKIVVTSPPIFSALSALLLSKIKRVPYILDVRDIWPDSAVQMGSLRNKNIIKLFEFLERQLYKNAESIVVATPGMVEQIRAKMDSRIRKKIEYIPCGVTVFSDEDIAEYRGKSEIAKKFSNKFVVLYAGLHGHAQNLRVILDAACILEGYEDIIFYFVGDGPEKDELQQYVKDNSINNVFFNEPVTRDQIRQIYCDVQCALVPLRDISIFKSVFPSKTFELMSFGVPIIIGVGGEIDSIILSGNSGLVVEPDCAESYSKAILELYNNERLRNEISISARAQAKREFDYAKLNEKYKSIIIVRDS